MQLVSVPNHADCRLYIVERTMDRSQGGAGWSEGESEWRGEGLFTL